MKRLSPSAVLDRFFRRSPAVGSLSRVRAGLRDAARRIRTVKFGENGDLATAVDKVRHITSPLTHEADYMGFLQTITGESEPITGGQADALVRHQELRIDPPSGEYCGAMIRAIAAESIEHRLRKHVRLQLAKHHDPMRLSGITADEGWVIIDSAGTVAKTATKAGGATTMALRFRGLLQNGDLSARMRQTINDGVPASHIAQFIVRMSDATNIAHERDRVRKEITELLS